MEIDVVFRVLEQGLKLWNSKESTEYMDKTAKLKKRWYEAYNAPQRDHNKLDDIELELRILSAAFIKASGIENPLD